MSPSRIRRDDAGQTTMLMPAIVALALAVMAGGAAIGRAAIDRSNARAAADAVALASVADPMSGAALADWYALRGVDVTRGAGASVAASVGDSQAATWAALVPVEVTTAPAVRAVVARAAQLTGVAMDSATGERAAVWLSLGDAEAFATVAGDLGMCPGATRPGWRRFELC